MFTRGGDVKASLGVGVQAKILEEVEGKIMHVDDYNKLNPLHDLKVAIVYDNHGEYRFVVNYVNYVTRKKHLHQMHEIFRGEESFKKDKLIEVLQTLYEVFKEKGFNIFVNFPKIKRVVPKTVASELVAVKPMDKPKGMLPL